MGSTTPEGLASQAADMAACLTVEQYVLWWLPSRPNGEVTYVDFRPLIADVCKSNIWQAFGAPPQFTEAELRDAVADLDDEGQLSKRELPVKQAATGSQGQPNPQKIYVVVTQR